MGETVLGMAGQWAADYCEMSDHYTTKVGGLPDWPVSDLKTKHELLHCSLCGQRLCLIVQVYAPIALLEVNAEERVIYVFACPGQQCSNNPQSWRVLRVQSGNCDNELACTSVAEMPLDDNSTENSKPSNWLEKELLKNSNESDEESCSDRELEDLAQALAEASSLASSNKQNGSKHSDSSVKLPQSEPRVVGDSLQAHLPCFYIYSKLEQSPKDVGDFYASYSSLSLKEKENVNSDAENDETWEGETYEYDRSLGADRIFLKFKKRMDAYPEQCFRYSYGGSPLVATKSLVEPENCKVCGSSRIFEMQLMPPLVYFLQQGVDDSSKSPPDGWSWMTAMICTCSKSCCPPSDNNQNPQSWGVVEEVVIIQDE